MQVASDVDDATDAEARFNLCFLRQLGHQTVKASLVLSNVGRFNFLVKLRLDGDSIGSQIPPVRCQGTHQNQTEHHRLIRENDDEE